MRGAYLATAIALAAAGTATAQYQPAAITRIDESDDGNTIRVAVGDEISATLLQQGGTPYRWDLRNDPHLRLITGPTTDTAPGGNRPGGAQLRRFRIRVVESGRFPLIFALRSAVAGPNQTPVRRILVNVDAREGRPIDPRPIGPDTVAPLTEDDAYNEIDVPVGQRMTIVVPSNGSTGYSWSLAGSSNVAILGGIVEQRPSNARIGQGGTSSVRFYVVRRGFPAEIQLRYLPPGGGRAAKTLVYRFRGI